MYSYEWDAETGGYVLNSTPLTFSKEPRPVYYREMDLLGFDILTCGRKQINTGIVVNWWRN